MTNDICRDDKSKVIVAIAMTNEGGPHTGAEKHKHIRPTMASPDATTKMVITLDEMKQSLGDGPYLRLTNELAAIRNSVPVHYKVTYRHTHLVTFQNPDCHEDEVRMVKTNHTQLCQLTGAVGINVHINAYDRIHLHSEITAGIVEAIIGFIRTKGYCECALGRHREIMIVKCERV